MLWLLPFLLSPSLIEWQKYGTSILSLVVFLIPVIPVVKIDRREPTDVQAENKVVHYK